MTELKLIDSKFIKINGNKNPKFSGEVNLKTNIKILELQQIKNTDFFKVNYIFEVHYGELGQIIIDGFLTFSSNQKTIKELQESFKNKKIENLEYITLTNIIMQKASIKALELEDELSLPVHLRLPKLEIKK